MEQYIKSSFVITDYVPTDIYPVQYGEEQCAPCHDFGPCVRSNYIIHYVYGGKGILRMGNDRYEVREGEMFLIKPNTLAYYRADEKEPWLYRWIEFNGSMSEKIISSFKLPVKSDDESKAAGDALEKITSVGEIRFEELMQKFWAFLSAIAEKTKESKGLHSEEYIKKAELFIKNNVHKRITVSKVAAHIGLNRSYLCRLFEKTLGISPQQYILNIKLNAAAQYLKNTDATIAEIASSVGYADYHVFGKAFKSKFNAAPSEWRKKQSWEKYIIKTK